MDGDWVADLWRQADEARGRGQIGLADLIELAKRSGPVSWQQVAALAKTDHRSEVGRPIFLMEFVADLARAIAPTSILDPWVATPLILASASSAVPGARATGLVRSAENEQIGRAMASANWRHGEPFELLASVEAERFDLILVFPPFGMQAQQPLLPEDPPSGRREFADVVLWRASHLLSSGGHLVFHTGDNIVIAEQRRTLLTRLEAEGIFAQAVISVDGGLTPVSSIRTSLVVFGRERYGDLFIGRLDRDSDVALQVRNLVSRQEGQAVELGTLTGREQFRGWHQFALELELSASFSSDETRLLGEIATVRRVELRADRPYETPPNCVFVPTLGYGRVTTSPPEVEGTKKYVLIEVIVDPSVVRAEYLASYLSTPTGGRLREAAGTGSYVPHLSAKAFARLRIPIPPLAVQEGAIRALTHLTGMETAIMRLRTELWISPDRAQQVLERLEAEAKADPIRRWTDALPYPMASVLRRYAAESSPIERVERLLHFFEVTAEFGCAVLIGVLRSVPDLLAEAQPDIAKAAPPGRELLERTDFGLWINLGQTLAKSMRRLRGDYGRRQRLQDAQEPAGELVDRLCEKAIWAVLNQAREIRNQWAHSGVRGHDQVAAWLSSLQTLLGEAEQALGGGFDDIDLARVEAGTFRNGLHIYERAQRLRGSSDVFDEFEIRTRTPIDAEQLAFVGRILSFTRVLQLAPLVRVGPSPSSSHNACYFFDSQESDDRYSFISYHFADEPKINLEDSDLTLLSRQLSGGSLA